MGTNQESRRARRSADEWRQVLSRFVGSGLAVEAFCNREGISDTSFYRWRSRLGAPMGRCEQRETERPGRIELTLDLGGGLQLHLVRG
jgi:putative transposase